MIVVTDAHPGAAQKFLRRPGIISELDPSVLMEVSQEGAMDTPKNGGVGTQPLEDVVVRTHYIYAFALALVFIALVVSAILLLLIDS